MSAAEDADLATALQAIRGVRQTMSALRWWLNTTDNGREMDNQIFRILHPVPDEGNDT